MVLTKVEAEELGIQNQSMVSFVEAAEQEEAFGDDFHPKTIHQKSLSFEEDLGVAVSLPQLLHVLLLHLAKTKA